MSLVPNLRMVSGCALTTTPESATRRSMASKQSLRLPPSMGLHQTSTTRQLRNCASTSSAKSS
eukprot:52365-Eustigmatos_ZCMA.PRE.1